jgi:uncharacterized protein YdeI (YjbR/CyaY-like superfamily)
MSELPSLPFESATAWEAWLQENHQVSDGIWMQIGKKSAGHPSITYDEAVDVALCYGWIDGQKNKHDDTAWLQKFTPRRKKSIWSKVNCLKVAKLTAEGRMQPAGLAQVEAAKTDGRWDVAYDSQSTMTMPEDFQAALDAHPKAKEFYESLPKSRRYSFLFRIQTTKKTENRAAKIEQLVAMLEEGKAFNYP